MAESSLHLSSSIDLAASKRSMERGVFRLILVLVMAVLGCKADDHGFVAGSLWFT
jgi:hypothetical protein